METEAHDMTPMLEFYKDASVFVTGGTGFLGKVLIEKLLRTCSNVRTIYLLVRVKRGKSIHQRTEELLEDALFDTLRTQEGGVKWQHKIVALSGDCTLPGLGLSIQDVQTLCAEVSVVFHVAATVRFDEKLKLALAINVGGTRDVLDLCRQMPNLKSVIHVSTAYSNCHLKQIDEKFYECPLGHEELELALEKLDDRTVEKMTPRLLGRWPNTYSLTKAMAEALVRESCGSLPVGVFRPAIVVSTYREPVPGWVDNYYGPTGVCAAAMMGVLRTLHCDDEVNANIVPVDMCVSALLASAWHVAREKRSPGEDPTIYNYVSSVEKPITWNEYNKINMMYGLRQPLCAAVWAVQFQTHRSAAVHAARMLLLHLLPALLWDAVATCAGREPRLLSTHHKVHRFSKVIAHFSTNNWHFSNGNIRRLCQDMDPRDGRLFDLDMARLDWLDFFKGYVAGIRLHLFKEQPNTVPQARARQARLQMVATLLKALVCYVAVSMAWGAIVALCRMACALLGLPPSYG